ncbi:hypothetical protein [Pelagicoccus albus]|uniref:Uncharacterized protein n=1 Tax=Pelagicoccus albus TaxID=415222 RepID=A0A7X1E8F4_9BACT|nr:hypothetical protein [Pelagicoccus albus]MBC2606093.1 hypothetical protein [Pelagicoccus albus]
MTRHFENDLLDSCRRSADFPVGNHYARYFRDYIGYRIGTENQDKSGTDHVVLTRNGSYCVDIKVRGEDPLAWGVDDLAVELYSCVENEVRGYQDKTTTHLMWIFPSTGRSVLIPFGAFRKVYDACFDYWDFWLAERPQASRHRGSVYHSTHCFVPTGLFGRYVLRHQGDAAGAN